MDTSQFIWSTCGWTIMWLDNYPTFFSLHKSDTNLPYKILQVQCHFWKCNFSIWVISLWSSFGGRWLTECKGHQRRGVLCFSQLTPFSHACPHFAWSPLMLCLEKCLLHPLSCLCVFWSGAFPLAYLSFYPICFLFSETIKISGLSSSWFEY